MIRLTAVTLCACLAASAALAQGLDLPGYDRFDLTAAHRARPVAASIWHPAAAPTYAAPIGGGPIFKPNLAYVGAAVAEGRHPLVLLSHGSGGNADGLGWLSSGLAAKGAMVLAVNHPGSTSGDSSARRSTNLGARAADLSAALDMVLADPNFAPFVDQARISVVGFSLGGATALNLAGLRFDGARQAENCRAEPKAADCVFFLRGGVDFATSPGFDAEAQDSRISRAVVVDPGFGGSAVEASLSAVRIPVAFVNLGVGADLLGAANVGPDGNDLAARLSEASLTVIAPASHFTFLGECQPGGAAMLAEERDDPICDDPAGADRGEVHRRLVEEIAKRLGL